MAGGGIASRLPHAVVWIQGLEPSGVWSEEGWKLGALLALGQAIALVSSEGKEASVACGWVCREPGGTGLRAAVCLSAVAPFSTDEHNLPLRHGSR